jgi:hypothetical protein
MSKVVVISPYRTATQSTNILLQQLGYKTLHYGGKAINNFILKGYSKDFVLEKMSVFTEMFDAFSDNPFPVMYEYFDITYPGSKFIMIKRSPESWYESLKRLNVYLNKDIIDPFERTFFETYLTNVPERFDEISIKDYTKTYNSHIEAVNKYFQGKDNLLSLDISDEKKGIKIAQFLDKDFFPNKDFIKDSPLTNGAFGFFESSF